LKIEAAAPSLLVVVTRPEAKASQKGSRHEEVSHATCWVAATWPVRRPRVRAEGGEVALPTFLAA
jgi:hypothetical protein